MIETHYADNDDETLTLCGHEISDTMPLLLSNDPDAAPTCRACNEIDLDMHLENQF